MTAILTHQSGSAGFHIDLTHQAGMLPIQSQWNGVEAPWEYTFVCMRIRLYN